MTITDGDFSIPLTIMGRTTSQRESKETEDLTNTASWVSRSYKNALPTTHTHSLLKCTQGASQTRPRVRPRVCVCVSVSVTQSCAAVAILWTAARQAPLSVGFSRQEYWSGMLCPPPGDPPDPGIEPTSPALQADSLPLSHQGSWK